MKKYLMFFALGLVLIGLISFVSAVPMPHAFHGNVYYSDGTTPILDSLEITAEIDGNPLTSTMISDGRYDLTVESETGGMIYFFITESDGTYEEIGSHVFEQFEITELDFTTTIVKPAPPAESPPANNPPASSSGGGGGGGGSPSNPSNDAGTIHIISVAQMSNGITKNIGLKDEMKFEVRSEQHTLSLNTINRNSASITVQSNPITFVLEIGQEKKIDFDIDGFYDLKVKLEGIENNEAKINVKSISEEVPKGGGDGEKEGTVGLNQSGGDTDGGQSSGITGSAIGFVKSGKGAGIIVAVVILAIGGFVLRKRKVKR